MTDAQLLEILRALPTAPAEASRSRFNRPTDDLALQIRLDAFVNHHGGVVIAPPLQLAAAVDDPGVLVPPAFYDVPAELVS